MEDLREGSSLLQLWFPLPSTSQQPLRPHTSYWQLHPQPPSHAVSETDRSGLHEIDGDVRKITYSNGVTIYINYSDEAESMDGKTLPAMSYEMEGI